MKKILLISFLGLLVAAGCNKVAQNQSVNEGQSINPPASNSTSTSNSFDGFDTSTLPKPGQVKAADTAGWKTYTSTEFGFQFKYPSTWTIRDLGSPKDGLYLNIEEPDSSIPNPPIGDSSAPSIGFLVNPKNLMPTTANEFLNDENSKHTGNLKTTDIKGFSINTINGNTAYHIIVGNNNDTFFYHNNYEFDISSSFANNNDIEGPNGQTGAQLLQIAQGMIYTLKFAK